MLKSYLKTTWRNLWNNRGYSFLNITGLAVGVACAGLIFLWVENESGFDGSFTNRDRLYWIRNNQSYNGVIRTFTGTPALLAPALEKEFPAVESVCRVGWSEKPLITRGDRSIYENGFSADPSIFPMFTLRFVEGQARDAFRQMYSIVISEKMARQFFPGQNSVTGKTLRMDNKQEYQVTGVFRNLQDNSTLQFDWLTPFDVFLKDKEWAMKYWGANAVKTYITLRPGADLPSVDRQLYSYLHLKDTGIQAKLFLFGMKDWRLRDHFEGGHQSGGRIEYVRMFSIIAWVVILIACINFMNLATARSEKRAREVGVRKVLGAEKRTLIAQFIGEALMQSFFAVGIGLMLIALVLPAFNKLVEEQLMLNLQSPAHAGAIVIIALICGLVAGSYPALYLSSFRPVLVFKGNRLKGSGASGIRRGLVVFQFVISIVLIISTILIYQQVQHIKSRDLGYDKDNLIDMSVTGTLQKDFDRIRLDLLQTGVVDNAALCSQESLYTTDNDDNYHWAGKNPKDQILISRRSVTKDYFATLGMQLVDGHGFHAYPASDSSNVIITQSMARLIGRGSAVGKILRHGGRSYTVVGVIRDYIYGDMYGSPDPVVFYHQPAETNYFYVRYSSQAKPDEALAKISAVIRKDNPGYPFDYAFVDDTFNDLFKGESLVGDLSRIFAGLAIIISCLGLFGLSSYMAERRTKEIGIRKVLGASIRGIAGLLAQEFLRLVALSVLIAFPIAWWVMDRWLRDYAYRISIQWWVFALSGLLAVLIAMTTIGFQSLKAARTSLVKSLRTE